MITDLKITFEDRPKTAFYAGDTFKSALDLYFGFTHEPKTNPPEWFETLKWAAGNGVESAMLKVLKENGKVPQDYDQKIHGRVDIEREGVPIHGYIDAKTVDGEPIEIKSINNANYEDVKKYKMGNPRENYVGQLAIYLDALDLDHGYLFVSSIDGLNRFWFDCRKIGHRLYKCGNVTVDLDKEYKRWASIYFDNVIPGIMPDIWEYRYKVPVSEVNWKSLKDGAIIKARNNHAVIGDYQIGWSDWKDKIVELQGETLGYTKEELEYIKEQTAGYSSKK